MHCGKKWWIREFFAPYIFPLNPDYVAARSLRSLRSNNTYVIDDFGETASHLSCFISFIHSFIHFH